MNPEWETRGAAVCVLPLLRAGQSCVIGRDRRSKTAALTERPFYGMLFFPPRVSIYCNTLHAIYRLPEARAGVFTPQTPRPPNNYREHDAWQRSDMIVHVHARLRGSLLRSPKTDEELPGTAASILFTAAGDFPRESQNMSKHTMTKAPSSKSKRERMACCCSSLESAPLACAGCDATW